MFLVRSPVAYHSAGFRWGTATFKFYDRRDNLEQGHSPRMQGTSLLDSAGRPGTKGGGPACRPRATLPGRLWLFIPEITLKGYEEQELLASPPQRPRANGICERINGTPRRELSGRLLILNEHHLRRVLTEYLLHHNQPRPHRSPGQLAPAQAPTRPPQTNLAEHPIRRKQVLGELTREYQIAMTISGSRINGNTASSDTNGNMGLGGGIANVNAGPS